MRQRAVTFSKSTMKAPMETPMKTAINNLALVKTAINNLHYRILNILPSL